MLLKCLVRPWSGWHTCSKLSDMLSVNMSKLTSVSGYNFFFQVILILGFRMLKLIQHFCSAAERSGVWLFVASSSFSVHFPVCEKMYR